MRDARRRARGATRRSREARPRADGTHRRNRRPGGTQGRARGAPDAPPGAEPRRPRPRGGRADSLGRERPTRGERRRVRCSPGHVGLPVPSRELLHHRGRRQPGAGLRGHGRGDADAEHREQEEQGVHHARGGAAAAGADAGQEPGHRRTLKAAAGVPIRVTGFPATHRGYVPGLLHLLGRERGSLPHLRRSHRAPRRGQDGPRRYLLPRLHRVRPPSAAARAGRSHRGFVHGRRRRRHLRVLRD